LLLAELWRNGLDITRVLWKRDTRAASTSSSATAHVQEYSKVSLLGKVRNVTSNVQEVLRIVLKADTPNSGAAVKYCFVLSAGSVCESNDVFVAPLELISKLVHAILHVERLLREEPVSFEQRVQAAEDGVKARLKDNHAVCTLKAQNARDSTAAKY
jgi:hypothetical protein